MFVFIASVLFGIAAAVDYCDPNLCNFSETHVACNNPGNWASSCPRDRDLIPMTDSLKNQIVAAHNKWRDITAAGNSNGLPTASKMGTITWDSELEQFAELNVKTCNFEHDNCRNTPFYQFAGQNMAMGTLGSNADDTVVMLANSWYEQEVKLATSAVIDSCCGDLSAGHFTAMVNDRTTKIGCAASRFYNANFYGTAVLLTCNYNSGNVAGHPVYRKGPTASNCPFRNPQYPNLCGPYIAIDPNDFQRTN